MEKDWLDAWGPCVLRLLSPEWFRAIFRKRYGGLLLVLICTSFTATAVSVAHYHGLFGLATALFIVPYVTVFMFLIGDIATFSYNRSKKDDGRIGLFRVVAAYVLLVMSSGGIFMTLWLWHPDSFPDIEFVSPAEAWSFFVSSAMFVAPGVNFERGVPESVGANWLTSTIAFFNQILFLFVIVVAVADYKTWVSDKKSKHRHHHPHVVEERHVYTETKTHHHLPHHHDKRESVDNSYFTQFAAE